MSHTDDALLDALRRALDAVDPVGSESIAAAKAVFLTRDIDDELAQLVHDSARGDAALALRGAGFRSLSFEGAGRSIELEVDLTELVVRGQLSPPTGATAALEIAGEVVDLAAIDELGRFVLRGIDDDVTTVHVRVGFGDQHLLCVFDL